MPGAAVISPPTPTNATSGVSITYAAPTAEESNTSLHFGAQAAGTASPGQTLTVNNNGSAPLVVSGILLGGSDPGDFLTFDHCQHPVAVGSSCDVGVRFYPQVAGGRSAMLTLLTNAASAPPAVTLAGGTAVTGPGPAGKVELLRCKLAKVHHEGGKRTPPTERCTGKVIRGTVKFTITGAATRATIKRGGKVLA